VDVVFVIVKVASGEFNILAISFSPAGLQWKQLTDLHDFKLSLDFVVVAKLLDLCTKGIDFGSLVIS
jgi:hypothetical protein